MQLAESTNINGSTQLGSPFGQSYCRVCRRSSATSLQIHEIFLALYIRLDKHHARLALAPEHPVFESPTVATCFGGLTFLTITTPLLRIMDQSPIIVREKNYLKLGILTRHRIYKSKAERVQDRRITISDFCDEVLHQIFLRAFHAAEGARQTSIPWDLAAVYRQWRVVCLTSSSLWTAFIVGSGHSCVVMDEVYQQSSRHTTYRHPTTTLEVAPYRCCLPSQKA